MMYAWFYVWCIVYASCLDRAVRATSRRLPRGGRVQRAQPRPERRTHGSCRGCPLILYRRHLVVPIYRRHLGVPATRILACRGTANVADVRCRATRKSTLQGHSDGSCRRCTLQGHSQEGLYIASLYTRASLYRRPIIQPV